MEASIYELLDKVKLLYFLRQKTKHVNSIFYVA